MIVNIYTDGGARGNPGPAGFGLVIYDNKQNILYKNSKYIGIKTNNEAEYTAAIRALELVKEKFVSGLESVTFYSDSQLMVRQLNGEYKVKQPHIRDFVFKVRILEAELAVPVLYNHVLRDKNKLADALVNDAA